MGSDMYMNPPKTLFRANWEDEDTLVIEVFYEATGKGWTEIWRGTYDEVQKNRKILPIQPPPHKKIRGKLKTPSLWEEEVSQNTRIVLWHLGQYGPTYDCMWLKGIETDYTPQILDPVDLDNLAKAASEAARWLRKRQQELKDMGDT